MPKVDLARRLEIEDRRAEVLRLRLEKTTFPEIAARLGIHEITAKRDFIAALKAHRDNASLIAGQVKAKNQQRLERLIEEQASRTATDEAAAGKLMRAIDLLNKMYSVYDENAPMQGNAPAGGNTLIIKYEQHTITVRQDAPRTLDGPGDTPSPRLLQGAAYRIDVATDADADALTPPAETPQRDAAPEMPSGSGITHRRKGTAI